MNPKGAPEEDSSVKVSCDRTDTILSKVDELGKQVARRDISNDVSLVRDLILKQEKTSLTSKTNMSFSGLKL